MRIISGNRVCHSRGPMTENQTNHRFAFTAFKDPKLTQLPENVRYVIYQHEKCPTTGKDHWQGYIEFFEKVRYGTVQSTIHDNTAHIKPAYKCQAANTAYCSKSESAIEEPIHFGEPTLGKQGKRTDLVDLRKEVWDDGKTIQQLLDEKKINNYQQLKFCESIQKYKKPKRRTPIVFWITGESGSGKSLYADHLAGEDAYWLGDNAKFWDGYQGESTIVIDDLKPGFFSEAFLLRLLDRYPFRVESKGSSIAFQGERIFITSIYHPQLFWYHRTSEPYTQLSRRLTYIMNEKGHLLPTEMTQTPNEVD